MFNLVIVYLSSPCSNSLSNRWLKTPGESSWTSPRRGLSWCLDRRRLWYYQLSWKWVGTCPVQAQTAPDRSYACPTENRRSINISPYLKIDQNLSEFGLAGLKAHIHRRNNFHKLNFQVICFLLVRSLNFNLQELETSRHKPLLSWWWSHFRAGGRHRRCARWIDRRCGWAGTAVGGPEERTDAAPADHLNTKV